MMESRVRLTISGTVQGVGFRYFIYRQALGLGVRGWVRNTADGSVEAVFEGDEAGVESLVDLCRRGPLGAGVTDVDVSREEFKGEYSNFKIAR